MMPREGQWATLMPPRRPAPCTQRAFTLIELLVSMAIIGVLLAILLPAIGSTMRSARAFRCQMSLRSVAFDFTVFADDQMHGDRGDDAQLGPGRFRLETFVESQYGIDEFWNWGSPPVHTLPDAAGNDPMRCPAVRGVVTVYSGTPCSSQGAVTPGANVSYGFNMRLHIGETVGAGGQPSWQNVTLTSSVAQENDVPLVWDVDGERAEQLPTPVTPVFSAPSLGTTGIYANDARWFPASRHQGGGNYAFLDGSVRSSRRPLEQDGWRWGYSPIR